MVLHKSFTGKGNREKISGLHSNPELFVDFSYSCRFAGFTRLDLAPRKLPEPAMGLVLRALLHEHLTGRVQQREGDNDPHCRRIFHVCANHQPFLREPTVKTAMPLSLGTIMKTFLRKFFRNDRGATAIEYGLLISLIGLAATFGMKSFGDAMYNMYLNVDNSTSDKVQGN